MTIAAQLMGFKPVSLCEDLIADDFWEAVFFYLNSRITAMCLCNKERCAPETTVRGGKREGRAAPTTQIAHHYMYTSLSVSG